MDQNSNVNLQVVLGDFPIKYGPKTQKHPWSISQPLSYRGVGSNGPTFKNIGYGSHMKKKNVLFGMYVYLVLNFLDAQ